MTDVTGGAGSDRGRDYARGGLRELGPDSGGGLVDLKHCCWGRDWRLVPIFYLKASSQHVTPPATPRASPSAIRPPG